MSHPCKANCVTVVEDQFLFCPRHWRMIPQELKKPLAPKAIGVGAFEVSEADKKLYEAAIDAALTVIQETQKIRQALGRGRPVGSSLSVTPPNLGPLK